MSAKRLRLVPTAPVVDRGRLLDATEVASGLFGGHVTPQWVRRHVEPRVRLGHRTVLWYEADVRAWIDHQRENVA